MVTRPRRRAPRRGASPSPGRGRRCSSAGGTPIPVSTTSTRMPSPRSGTRIVTRRSSPSPRYLIAFRTRFDKRLVSTPGLHATTCAATAGAVSSAPAARASGSRLVTTSSIVVARSARASSRGSPPARANSSTPVTSVLIRSTAVVPRSTSRSRRSSCSSRPSSPSASPTAFSGLGMSCATRPANASSSDARSWSSLLFSATSAACARITRCTNTAPTPATVMQDA